MLRRSSHLWTDDAAFPLSQLFVCIRGLGGCSAVLADLAVRCKSGSALKALAPPSIAPDGGVQARVPTFRPGGLGLGQIKATEL